MMTNAIYNRPVVGKSHNANLQNRTRLPFNTLKDETKFEIQLAVAGIPKEEIAIEIEENKLVIQHIIPENKTENNSKVISGGFDYNGFIQKFSIPENVEAEKITASYDLGILKVYLPIKEKYHKKSIEVK